MTVVRLADTGRKAAYFRCAKRCGRCGEAKGLREFPLKRSAPDGRYTYCAACVHAVNAARRSDPELRAAELAQQRERRANDPELRAQRNAQKRSRSAEYARRPIDLGDSHLPKRCTTPAAGGCGRLLTRYEFNRKRSSADFREPWCRACKGRRNAERRALKMSAQVEPFSAADQVAHWLDAGYLMTSDDRFLCVYCGSAPAEHEEHVQPLSRGGEHSVWNTAPACEPCNLSKGTRLVTEWIADRSPGIALWLQAQGAL
ncbi:HNH endonuclease [Streptomyces sp. NPDC058698]|uniref:HNH endonuclease n=1 Tax=Streptomyces sp. NPDC058698 TaxID=3346606 RepID=UPI0036656011